LPFIAVKISAGLIAVPLGMFSVAAQMAITLIFGFNCAMAPHRGNHSSAAGHIALSYRPYFRKV